MHQPNQPQVPTPPQSITPTNSARHRSTDGTCETASCGGLTTYMRACPHLLMTSSLASYGSDDNQTAIVIKPPTV
jgi:hypothetical protein